MYKNSIVRRGNIYWVNLPEIKGSSIQRGYHPCLVLQNDTGNEHSPNVQVCTLTSQIQKRKLPTQIFVGCDSINNLQRDSIVQIESTTNIPQTLVGEYIGKLDAKTMAQVDKAIEIQFGIRKVEYFDENYVTKILLDINKMREMFFKYKDEYFIQLNEKLINELKSYCCKHNKNYTCYYKDVIESEKQKHLIAI